MKRKDFFEKDQLVHLISRAVDERKIFQNRDDCLRFMFQLYIANIGAPKHNFERGKINKITEQLLRGGEITESDFITDRHEPFIYIIDFSLVMTHYHLYAIVNIENSVADFIGRLNNGFAKYFNLKHNRKGALFGSRYKGVLINSDFQADAVSRYVSVINPLDVYQPGWRERGIENYHKALDFLETYEFSSFPDRIGKRKSKILTPAEVTEKYLPENNIKSEDYKSFVENFLQKNAKEEYDFNSLNFE